MSLLNRRRFLQTLGLGVSGLTLADREGRAQAIPPPRTVSSLEERGLPANWKSLRKIDCHMHVGLGSGARKSDDTVIEAADALGIEKLLTSLPVVGGRVALSAEIRKANDQVLAAMRRYPGRILGYCFLIPGDKDALDEFDRCFDQGMIGVKLYNQYKYSDPIVFPIVEKCIRHRVPLLGHAGRDYDKRSAPGQPNKSNAEDFCRLAERYPEAKLIHAHIHGGGDWEWGIKRLRSCPTVYLDMSGSGMEYRGMDEAVKILGHKRVLFGTDTSMEIGVGRVFSADLTAEQREDVFWRNIQEILNQRKS